MQTVSQTTYQTPSSVVTSILPALTTKRQWNATHINEDCSTLSGLHHNELMYGCTFDDLNNLILSNCDLSESKFVTDDLRKMLNFTVTVNCHSVRNVEYSELLFDMFLIMMTKTKGNDEKREKLLDIIGREKAERIYKIISRMEG